ncbi:hypothetical protein [Aquabacterium sp.]|uniref:hypothetical protein n=1 Tax=Aquabacterium sp. TaxID=1872578 RepID=UPI002CBE2AD6|nr:hypothetical protein [Aquabacterium sp.]HSW08260.1 hypothetical protein [Aquabacterium sp.]
MSASMTFGRATRTTIPRGSRMFANGAAVIIGLLRRMDTWQLKQAKTEPQTAQQVLDWARRIETTDPGFAADLRAAVYRSQEQQ